LVAINGIVRHYAWHFATPTSRWKPADDLGLTYILYIVNLGPRFIFGIARTNLL